MESDWVFENREYFPAARRVPGRGRTVRLKITFDSTKEFGRFVAHLRRLSESYDILLPLIRQAAAETILTNIQQRFLYNLPNALEMETRYVPHENVNEDVDSLGQSRNVDSGTGQYAGGPHSRDRDTAEMAARLKLYKRLTAAQKRGNPKTLARIYEALSKQKVDFIKSLNRSRTTKQQLTPHKLSSGLFRPLALKILEMLTDASLASVELTGANRGTVTVSVGDRQRLNLIGTPSATEHVLKPPHKTSSPYDIMWRHLEFGTGVYSKDPFGAAHPATKYTALGGGWWYDPNPPGGLYVRGSRGIHALRDAQTGEPYEADFSAFSDAVGTVITQWLSRKSR